MNVNNVYLDVVTGRKDQLPDTDFLEIAFAGKSNVGKSSLLNTLINRKSLARTSSKPGKTQTINFYNVEEQLYFVDLPGYGYAKVSKADRERWGRFIEDYLTTRQQLRLVVLLIDIRHEPGKNDVLMYDWIKYQGFEPLIIATKMDKLKRSQIKKHLNVIQKALKMPNQKNIIPFSAVSKQGKDEIWERFDTLLQEYADQHAAMEDEVKEIEE
ncbi:ribosome biogenesis GTP-binding protein YihA/YsxC [Vallitalea okinawensis]|uniref:ribosome biogenesis GTP-binding protein YihA/YsxC n=1 Tax=Vallitalea okinawensis TaxID=2078660 RepID=UPI000CFBECD8|nr:ribosome biogenesis GTP-binding protein YihA/YsxC [Vallitalea okinawensis]